MGLLPGDKEFLDSRGYNYDVHEDTNETLLVIKNYSIASRYDQEMVNVLIKIPKGYPITKLDMFWVYPHIRIKSTNEFPAQANVFNDSLGKKWQRFSRHYDWKPTFGLVNHMYVLKNVLVDERG